MILIMKILLHNEYKIINLWYPTYVYQFFNLPYNYKNRVLACFQTRPNLEHRKIYTSIYIHNYIIFYLYIAIYIYRNIRSVFFQNLLYLLQNNSYFTEIFIFYIPIRLEPKLSTLLMSLSSPVV